MGLHDGYALAIASLFPNQGEWTEEDYFALPETPRIVELSNGELIVNPPPTPAHQQATGNLYSALRTFVASRDLGSVLFAPVAVRLTEGRIREPDVLFVRRENLHRIGETGIDGPPDWVAEVISPGTRRTDEEDKLAEYAQARIAEYWLVDLENRTIRVFALAGSDYHPAGAYEAGQVARSETLEGFAVKVEAIIPSARS
jgi:Uma2 family endonuclease